MKTYLKAVHRHRDINNDNESKLFLNYLIFLIYFNGWAMRDSKMYSKIDKNIS
jgi:hypothetical protein